MRKNIYQTSCIITGVAALFVGLAGTVQAIPMTIHNHNVQQALPSTGQNNQSRITPATSPVASSVQSPNAGQPRSGHHVFQFGHGATPILTPVTNQGAHPVSGLHSPILPIIPVNLPPIVHSGGGTTGANAVGVPDGGTTAMMMGGAFCGLALIKRKLKA